MPLSTFSKGGIWMIFDRLTITSADDKVDHSIIEDLNADYVEWGILFSQKRPGTPRYPSYEWTKKLVEKYTDRDLAPEFSAHVCGRICEDLIHTWDPDPRKLPVPFLPTIFGRIQLNAYPDMAGVNININRLASALRDTDLIL